jgi:2-methylcitrate dehydratase PrpD
LERVPQRQKGTLLTVIEELADFIARHCSSVLPPEVTHESKRAMLNVLSAALAAVDDPAVIISDRWAGRRAATESDGAAHVLWRATPTSVEDAAFVNAVMMQVLDFDDTYVPAFIHPSCVVLGATFATAEAVNASGRGILHAFALGVQVTLALARMLFPSHHGRGFHVTATAGAVGAAAACAALRGLDEEQTRNALGVAMAGGSGLNQMFGSMTKDYQIGDAARTGVIAAELASRGFTSMRDGFEGLKGMLRAMSDEPINKLGPILKSLDHDWPILRTNYKAYPAGESLQAPIECTLEVRGRVSGAQAKKVERMVARVLPYAETRVGHSRHISHEATPSSLRRNLQYCMAAAWNASRFTEEQFRPAAIRDERTLLLRDRITLVADPAVPMEGCALEVVFADGESEECQIEAYKGSAQNPLADSDVETKLLESAASRLDNKRRRDVLTTIWNIDILNDFHALANVLANEDARVGHE